MTEATALTLVLPWPDMRLMPNRKNGRHWGGVQSAKEQARRDGRVAAVVELGRRRFIGGDRIPVKVTFMSPDRRGATWTTCWPASSRRLTASPKPLRWMTNGFDR